MVCDDFRDKVRGPCQFFTLGIIAGTTCYNLLYSLKSTQHIKQADIYLSEISLDSRASNDCNFHYSRKVSLLKETGLIPRKEKYFLK